MNPVFLTQELLEKFNAKAQEIAAHWDYPKDQFFQVYTMVATIELGLTDRCFYFGDGIIFDGWNGYWHTAADKNDPNPYSAYNGFYRMERNQMAGWSCYLIYRASDKQDQLSRCNSAYGYWFEWEEQPKVWGYTSFQEYYTEAEAQEALVPYQGKKTTKRWSIKYSDMSGCYRLRIESTKKTGLRNCWRGRIAK